MQGLQGPDDRVHQAGIAQGPAEDENRGHRDHRRVPKAGEGRAHGYDPGHHRRQKSQHRNQVVAEAAPDETTQGRGKNDK